MCISCSKAFCLLTEAGELRQVDGSMKVGQNHSLSSQTLHTKGSLAVAPQRMSFHPSMTCDLGSCQNTNNRQSSSPLLFGSFLCQAVKFISVPAVHVQVPSSFMSFPPSKMLFLRTTLFQMNCSSSELCTEARCPLKDVHTSSASWKVSPP